MNRFTLAAAGLGAVAFSCGCNRAPHTVGLQGQVTFDGQPVESGLIVFEPIDKHAQRRDARITSGTFAIAPDAGLHPGDEFTVVIRAFRKTGKKFPGPDPSITYDEEIQYLPAKYNSASTLRVTISPEEDENPLTFGLTSR